MKNLFKSFYNDYKFRKLHKFVILTHARTGSNFLIHQLNRHPDILCHYELYHSSTIYYGFGDKGVNKSLYNGSLSRIKRNLAPVTFLHTVFQHTLNCITIGFKLFVFPMHNKEVFRYVMRHDDMKKIVLRRRNIVKNYVSLQLAKKTGIWSSIVARKQNIQEKVRVPVQYPAFLKYVKKLRNEYRSIEDEIEKKPAAYLSVYYEDITSDHMQILRLHDFLGVKRVSENLVVDSKFTKQNSDNLRDLIENYDEFADAIRGTEYEQFLSE